MKNAFVAASLLLVLPLSAAFAQGGGKGPVGLWDVEMVDDSGAVEKAVVEFHFGGTATVISSVSPYAASYGAWKKTGKRTFVVSFYAIFADEVTGEHVGYIKSLVENTLVDRDTMEGRTEVWFLVGTDPFNPIDMFPVLTTHDLGRRLVAEGPS
jgi:hypothetical protein